jgi:hypothetical protein
LQYYCFTLLYRAAPSCDAIQDLSSLFLFSKALDLAV